MRKSKNTVHQNSILTRIRILGISDRNTTMKFIVFFTFFLAIVLQLRGQDIHFLDSLYQYKFSHEQLLIDNEQKAQIQQLKKDYGLAAGINMSNFIEEEFSAGMSTRLFAKASILKGGMLANKQEARAIESKRLLDELQGIKSEISYNTEYYREYITYLFNLQRVKQLDSLLETQEEIRKQSKALYYNKMLDYSEIILLEDEKEQYLLMRSTLKNYTSLFSSFIKPYQLPTYHSEHLWNVDFGAIISALEIDTLGNEILALQKDIVDYALEKPTLPTLSASVGYDVSRVRPFYAVNFSVSIRSKNDEYREAKFLSLESEMKRNRFKKKQLVRDIQIRYSRKLREYSRLIYKLSDLKETSRKYKVKEEIYSLETSIDAKLVRYDIECIQLDMIRIKEECLLLLLALKEGLPNTEIGQYLSAKTDVEYPKKFAGTRVYITQNKKELSKVDRLFLEQNELTIRDKNSALTATSHVVLFPSEYRTRADMEEKIEELLRLDSSILIVFQSLEELKDLDRRTLAYSNSYSVNNRIIPQRNSRI